MKLSFKKKLAIFLGVGLGVIGTIAMVSAQTKAIGEGQIEGGDIYRVKNLTDNSAFANTQTADKCEALQYKVRLHNPGPGVLNNVNVKVDLPSQVVTTNVSKVSITSQNSQPATTTANAVVNISSPQSIKYVSGSTELLDTYGKVLNKLPDTITGSGVNIGNVGVSLLEIKFVQFKANINCETPKPPVYSCDLLQASTISDRKVRFTASASASNGATIKDYVFNYGDGKEETVNSNTVDHVYAQDGTYTAKVKVAVMVNGQIVYAESPKCQTTVKFKTPEVPVYSCDLLKAQMIGDKQYRFTASASASNGATIKNYVYNFGDGSNEVSTGNTTVDHTYSKAGTYKAVLRVMVLVNGSVKEVSGPQCETTIKIEEKVTPAYSCDLLTIEKNGTRQIKLTVNASASGGATVQRYIYSFGDGSADLITDKTVVTHTYAKDGDYAAEVKVQVRVGDETKTIESDKCAGVVSFTTPTTPVTPGALPNTGAGNIIATFLAVSGVSTFAYYIVSRRFARF